MPGVGHGQMSKIWFLSPVKEKCTCKEMLTGHCVNLCDENMYKIQRNSRKRIQETAQEKATGERIFV